MPGGRLKSDEQYKIIHSGKYPFHIIPIIRATKKFRYSFQEAQEE